MLPLAIGLGLAALLLLAARTAGRAQPRRRGDGGEVSVLDWSGAGDSSASDFGSGGGDCGADGGGCD